MDQNQKSFDPKNFSSFDPTSQDQKKNDLMVLILKFFWSRDFDLDFYLIQSSKLFDLWSQNHKIKTKFDPMICNKILAWSFDLNLLSILISWSVFLEFFDPMICIFRIFWSGDLYFQRFDFWSYDLPFPKSRDLQFRFFKKDCPVNAPTPLQILECDFDDVLFLLFKQHWIPRCSSRKSCPPIFLPNTNNLLYLWRILRFFHPALFLVYAKTVNTVNED